MIAKHVAMRETRRSDFAGLADYITSAQGRDERVGKITVTNCGHDEVQDAVTDVQRVQEKNKRAHADKTYHLIISFPPGEHPSAAVLADIEAKICAGLGYGEHQRISAVHHDTDHTHLHLAINKIHPARLTIHSPLRDYRTLAELCDRLEAEYGLQSVNHHAQKRGGEGRAADMENMAGIESMISWVRRTCGEEIKAAENWKGLHATLAEHGLVLQAHGNGLVITAVENGTSIKASSVSRDLSKPALEKRFGRFEPGEGQAPQTRAAYEARPMPSRINTAALFERYRSEQANKGPAKREELAVAFRLKKAAIAKVQKVGEQRRAQIKAGRSAVSRKLSYSAASAAQKAARDKINLAYQQERARIAERHQRRTWAVWLQAQAMTGNAEALTALRARKGRQHDPENKLHPTPDSGAGISSVIKADHVTKTGTIIYRTPNAAIRDDGVALHVSRGAEIEGIVAALRIAYERYGETLKISGSEEFKERVAYAAARSNLAIRFDDPAMERRRQEIASRPREQTRAGTDIRGTTRRSDPSGGRQRADPDISRTRTSGAGATRIRGAGRADGASRTRGARPDHRGGIHGRGAGASTPGAGRKPDVARVGRSPPPEARGRVRDLSAIDMVRLSRRPSLLLPRDVRTNMDDGQAGRDSRVRRDVPRGGTVATATPAQVATDKYVAEREAKRHLGIAIQKHRPFEAGDAPLTYAGQREIDGQKLALLKRGDEIMVLPIDKQSAARVAKLAIGDPIQINNDGSVKPKGRAR